MLNFYFFPISHNFEIKNRNYIIFRMVCFIHSSSSISNRARRRKHKPLKSHLFKLFKFLPSSISYRTKLDKKNSQFPKRNVWIGAKKNSAELCIFFKFFCFLPLFRLKKLLLLTSGLFLTLKNIRPKRHDMGSAVALWTMASSDKSSPSLNSVLY